VDLNVKSNGFTALMYAVRDKHEEMVKFLIEAKADVTQGKDIPHMMAQH